MNNEALEKKPILTLSFQVKKSSTVTNAESSVEIQPSKAEPSPRLYVGNFTDKVTEYTIMKLFEEYGKIARIDYLWHQEGPKHGMPRGYCFVEMDSVEEAQTAAIASVNQKLQVKPNMGGSIESKIKTLERKLAQIQQTVNSSSILNTEDVISRPATSRYKTMHASKRDHSFEIGQYRQQYAERTHQSRQNGHGWKMTGQELSNTVNSSREVISVSPNF
ncbi:hypothetical protein BSLG_005851 [Batrachochytrium salamandrivorans]|nr:hypothetical protein BSLG_005851 [Batrachochytrium salamandrivorans]